MTTNGNDPCSHKNETLKKITKTCNLSQGYSRGIKGHFLNTFKEKMNFNALFECKRSFALGEYTFTIRK